MAKRLGVPVHGQQAAEQPSVLDLMPSDTPAYMADAWLSCIHWALSKTEIVDTFRAETGNKWRPARSGFEAMIDKATGSDWAFIKAFILWANVNVWGTLDGPRE